MAGHSKWANIKFRKAAQDSKRGKVFTKLIREITVSAQAGGADAESNPRLRSAIDKALSQNMTKDTIERAIKRGSGDSDNDNLEEVRYEGYGPGGVAVMVDCLTDNRNRTVSEVRHCFTKFGGNLGTDGSVSYLFSQRGQILIEKNVSEDEIMDLAIENGADDVVVQEDGSILIEVEPQSFISVSKAIEAAEIKPLICEITHVPANTVELSGEKAQSFMKFFDKLEDLDDVQDVFSNVEISDDTTES